MLPGAAESYWMDSTPMTAYPPLAADLDVDVAVIGGGVANSPEQLLASIRETVYRRSLPLATRDLLIQRSSLGGLAGVIGASSMVVDQLFARDAIGQWIEAGEPAGLLGA